jgi:trk system potassium uptake protein TrkH
MNFASVIRLLGALCGFLGLTMVFPLAWALGLGESRAFYGLVVSMGIAILGGASLFFLGHHGREGLRRKEGLAVVGLGWILAVIVGSLPYLFSGSITSPVDAFFETMSGFTTTGSSVIDDVEALPQSILFWRSFTHWLGGIGIVVLFLAILPHIGVGGRHLFRSEVSGAVKEAVTPRVKDTALFLLKTYTLLTLIETGLLKLAGMSWLDSFCHTFGTIATGGFSTKNASVGHYGNIWVEVIIIVFMVLGGTNFALYRPLARRKYGALLRDKEWLAYVSILGMGTLLVASNLVFGSRGLGGVEGVRQSAFQVVSVATCTGFITVDFDAWPSFSRLLLLALMFVGGCSGSTSGALKVMRVVILAKFGWARVQKVFRPHAVVSLRIGPAVLKDEVVREILAFFVLYIGIFLVASLALTVMGFDIISSVSAVATNMGNVGPGLGALGASETYAAVPVAGKILLSICMLLGRLEIYTILVLLSPAFWKR